MLCEWFYVIRLDGFRAVLDLEYEFVFAGSDSNGACRLGGDLNERDYFSFGGDCLV